MLNKKDFLGMIAVRFLKRFNDICAVDISKENSFRLKLDSGRSTFINCNFDSIYSDYTKDICDELGISREELLIAAVENTENAEYHIVGFKDIFENIGVPCPDIPMYAIVSNMIKTPALFASGKALNDIANRIQDDYWILPSSTEEFFILPKEQMNVKDRNDLLNLASIIKEANIEGAARKEGIFLSDSLYQYDRNKGFSTAI